MESIVYIIRDKNTKNPTTRRDAYDPYNATPEQLLHKARFYINEKQAKSSGYLGADREVIKVKIEVIEND